MDARVSKFDVYTVYSIGDQVMIVSGLPKQNDTRHATEIASMALDVLAGTVVFQVPHRPIARLMLRMGTLLTDIVPYILLKCSH